MRACARAMHAVLRLCQAWVEVISETILLILVQQSRRSYLVLRPSQVNHYELVYLWVDSFICRILATTWSSKFCLFSTSLKWWYYIVCDNVKHGIRLMKYLITLEFNNIPFQYCNSISLKKTVLMFVRDWELPVWRNLYDRDTYSKIR